MTVVQADDEARKRLTRRFNLPEVGWLVLMTTVVEFQPDEMGPLLQRGWGRALQQARKASGL